MTGGSEDVEDLLRRLADGVQDDDGRFAGVTLRPEVTLAPGEAVVVRRLGKVLSRPYAAGLHWGGPAGIDRIVRVRTRRLPCALVHHAVAAAAGATPPFAR